MNILFVCLGNICRSPAAEAIFSYLVHSKSLDTAYYIDSAGTYGGHSGELADVRMRYAASKRGYSLEHHSRKVATDDFERFDMIIAMDDSNYERLQCWAPSCEASRKIYRMTDFCIVQTADHIPDPYYEGAQGFDTVLDLLEDACVGLLNYTLNNKGK